jgi:hypothetical protein
MTFPMAGLVGASLMNGAMSMLYQATPTQIGTLFIDLTLNYTVTYEYPVAEKANAAGEWMTDQVRRKPLTLPITGFVSDTPLDFFTGVLRPGGDPYAAALAPAATLFPARAAYEVLKALALKRKPLVVVTDLDVFPNMIITQLDFPRSNESEGGLAFTCTLKEVITASAVPGPGSRAAKGMNAAPGAKDGCQCIEDRGRQATPKSNHGAAAREFLVA